MLVIGAVISVFMRKHLLRGKDGAKSKHSFESLAITMSYPRSVLFHTRDRPIFRPGVLREFRFQRGETRSFDIRRKFFRSRSGKRGDTFA